ncbi:c-type cytochrome [Candidatus Rickettsiella isopodorum]|jgi:cytochrome c5|uniref:c-type cytochrome n=1 Tax=Candidatus Rickettsiella isopodorum TaxID=1225476 RepID=UPI0009FE3CA9|nr:c-type cytochrome [Candidatus Rickettsiella isopodorum]
MNKIILRYLYNFLKYSFFISTLLLSSLAFANSNADPTKKNPELNIPYPPINYPKDAALRKLIKRGEYLSKAGDCIACHTDTKHQGQPFAGGLGIYTPFGSIYSPNITPDKTTGIGTWNDKDFIRAMHEGIAPNGSYYFPVFPFASFTKINTHDLLAIKAYLFSLDPVKKANHANEMMWPFNWRFLQLGWRILFFRPGAYEIDKQYTKSWNRGAYLVQGLGHCGMCHTPLNLLGAEKKKYSLTGGFIQGYYAPNISSSGLKGICIDDIRAVFKQNKLLRNAGVVAGPMAEVNSNSLKYLSTHDLNAIAVYLKTVKSQVPYSAFSGPITAKTGRKVYESYCAVCHASGAAGAPKLGDTVEWKKRLKQGKNIVYERAIHGFNSMPPKGTCTGCSDDAVKAAVDYLILNDQAGATKTIPVQEKPLSLKVGKQIYQQHCAICHDNGKLGAPILGDKARWQPIIAKNIDVLFEHTILGYKKMPAKGDCKNCSNSELEASVKYMVEQSKTTGNYFLW